MILRDVDNIKVGSTSVNKVYQGNYKVYDKNKIALEGYCKQNTTTGKNLLDYITNLIPTGYGLENTINEDGSITTTGIPLDGYRPIVKITDITDFLEDGEIYSISQLNPDPSLYIQVRIVDKENHGTYLNCPTSQSKSFTVDKTNNSSYWIMVQTGSLAAWGEESKSITNFYQLEKGTATEFEKYTGGQPSPNPNYPQEIEVMEGKQVVNVSSENVLPNNTTTQTINGITFTKNKNGSITLNGTATNNCDFYFVGNSGTYEELEIEDGNYNLNGCINGSGKTYMLYAVQNRNGNLYYYPNYYENGIVIDIKENDTFRIFIRVMIGQTLDNVVIKPQLNKGTNALPYVPYKSQDFEVDLKSKNKFDNITEKKVISTDGIIYNNDSWNLSDYIKVKPNTQYTFVRFDGTQQSLIIAEYDINQTFIQRNTQGSTTQNIPYTITTSNTTEYIRLNYNSTYGTTKLQLEEGSTATDYEPYYNYKLAGIGDYKDNIYTKKGKWYVKSLIGKVVLDGSENWNYDSNYNYFRVSNYNFGNKIPLPITNDNRKSYNQYCNLFKLNKAWSGANSFRDSTTTQGIFYPVQDLGYKLCFRNTNYQNVSDFKTWLSTHNTEVYYVLATPTEEEITSPTLIQQLNRLYQAM